MEESLEIKQEPMSDTEVDLLCLAENATVSEENKKETNCSKDLKSKKSVIQKEIPVSRKQRFSPSQTATADNDIIKEEEMEFPTPLACVEVKYELTDCTDNTATTNYYQSAEFSSNSVLMKTEEKCTINDKNVRGTENAVKCPVAHHKRHLCLICGKEYKMLCHLKSHMLIHTGEKPYLCSVCGKSFRLSTNLKMHSLIHSGEKPHVCERCGKAFSKRADLKQHFLTHTTELPHKCSLCGKGFRHALSLKVHTRTHTGEKPYSCTMCDRKFLTPSHLKTHTLSHTGEKPYVCAYCGKGFFTNKDLKRHQPIHSRDKPFVCSVCGRGFCQKSQLEPHMLRKHNIETTHICKICGLPFTGIQTLRIHSQTHAKNKIEINSVK